MKLRLLLLAVTFLPACASPAQRPRPNATPGAVSMGEVPPDVPAPAFVPSDIARRTHARVNEARVRQGFGALAWSDSLARLARVHSDDMARRAFFAHDNPDGENVNARATRLGLSCRIEQGRSIYTGFGENLFVTPRYTSAYRITENGRTTTRYAWKAPESLPGAAVNGWLNSPGHRRNLLSPVFRREGLAASLAADGQIYFTQVLC